MRRQIIVVFLSLFCWILPPAWGADRGALFKVTGSGHTMYLFGTMHAGLPEFYPLEPRIAGAVAHASTLALEIDPAQAAADMPAAMQQHGMFAPGSAGYKAIAPEFKVRLDRVLAKANIAPSAAAPLKPWLLATALAMHEFSALGYRADLGADFKLAEAARGAGVKVVGLESAGAQLALFDRLSEAEQWRVLEESVDMIESGRQRAELIELVNAWSKADKAALDAISLRAENDTSVFGRFVQQVMLEGRNGPLADKLAALLAREDHSVAAIGVLHLLGKHGVPALLRARGVTVERVY